MTRGSNAFRNQNDLYALLLEISDREIQEGLREVWNDHLVLILLDATPALIGRITDNLSKRGSQLLLENLLSAQQCGKVERLEGEFEAIDCSEAAKAAAAAAVFEVFCKTHQLRTA